MTDDSGRDDERPVAAPVSRRRLLALAGVGFAGSVAGCNDSDGGTDTPEPSPGPTGTPTSTPTDTPGSSATATDEVTATETETETQTQTETPTATATETATPAQLPEGGSYFGPGDGFVDVAPWLDDAEVYTVSEPTREALDEAVNRPEPNVVVFETSGTIDLGARRFNLRNDRCWIAGQTAPSPGVTLVRGEFQIAANDCIVQHVRVRPGDADQPAGEGWEPDSITTEDGSENNVFDHVSATWSVDEVASPGYETTNTTLSNCIIAEALVDATHHKGEHGYGSLVGDGAKNVALLGNVFAHNTARNPRLKAQTRSVVVNNVMYHFDEAVNLDDSTEASIVGNAFLRVDADDANVQGGKAYLEDNVSDPDTAMTEEVESYAGRPLWPGGLAAMPSGDVREHNLTYAGARPADRTETDRRILDHVRNDGGSYVDSQADVGGYPELDENTHTLDVPDANLRNWLQRWALAVEEPDVSPP